MQEAYEHALSIALGDAQLISMAGHHASCSAAHITPDVKVAEALVEEPLQVHGYRAPPSMPQVQQRSCPAASASVSACLLARQKDVPLLVNLVQEPTVSPQLALSAVAHKDAGPPGGNHGRFGNVSVVYDSGSASSRSPSENFSGGGRSLQKDSAGSVRSAAAQQQQQHVGARSGKNTKSRLGEEAGLSGKKAGKPGTPGQKRQALSELRPQKVKHSQREQQAWTQGTDDSDDFA